MAALINKISSFGTGLKDRITYTSKRSYAKTATFIKSRPMGSFFLVLGLLLVVLVLGQIFQPKPEEIKKDQVAKDVQIYNIGQGPQATFQAKVEKSGVVKIIAQSAGIVQHISVKEGDKTWKGQQLISLSTNYQGGNASSVQRQIAQTQYQNVLDTFGMQNELIQKQRDVATASAENAQQTRDISRRSADDTNSLININQSQLDQVNQQITALQATNPDDPSLAELQGSAQQLQGTLLQLRSTNRTTEYQGANDKPPALLSTLQKDIALKQLDVQQKTQEMNKDVSRLQVNLAAVTEGLMYPASPFTGTVERINVRKGQLVNPGTELATIAANDVTTTAVLLVPQAIAEVLSTENASQLIINDQTITVKPTHIATEATDGQLYAVRYEIPEDQQKYLTDGESIAVKISIKNNQANGLKPLIPIDAVYQTQENAFILIAEKNKAISRSVKLGKIYGNYVEVLSGLRSGDKVILNRNVVAQDKLTAN
jgi:RND family efflux transporter MFP subunit